VATPTLSTPPPTAVRAAAERARPFSPRSAERASRSSRAARSGTSPRTSASLPAAGGGRRGTLVAAAGDRYPWADGTALAAAVATDPKGRFERDGDRIRATYGHSIDVDLEPTDAPVPDVLYHGMPRRNAEAIREEGLRSMGRQTVHLSETAATDRSGPGEEPSLRRA
jgi:putative RNA 2'-phosphotransferase